MTIFQILKYIWNRLLCIFWNWDYDFLLLMWTKYWINSIQILIMNKAGLKLKCWLREETWIHVFQISSKTINCCHTMKLFAIALFVWTCGLLPRSDQDLHKLNNQQRYRSNIFCLLVLLLTSNRPSLFFSYGIDL